jgi:hypothetical protein
VSSKLLGIFCSFFRKKVYLAKSDKIGVCHVFYIKSLPDSLLRGSSGKLLPKKPWENYSFGPKT